MHKKRVWVIDDDPIFRMIVRSITHTPEESWEVEEFETVQDAQNALGNCDVLPHVILLDVNIPIGGGWLFLEHFEALSLCSSSISLFVCSSSIDSNDKIRAAQSSCVKAFLEKPLPLDFFQRAKP